MTRPAVGLLVAKLRDELPERQPVGDQPRSPRMMLEALAEKLDLRRAEPDEVLRRHGNRPVDTEDRDLEFVNRLDRIR